MRKADRKLSPAELEQFGAEIEAIRQKAFGGRGRTRCQVHHQN